MILYEDMKPIAQVQLHPTCVQGVSQLLKQSDWAQIQDFK